MISHTTAAVLQYVDSLLVLPAVEHANEAVWMCVWDETAGINRILYVVGLKVPLHINTHEIHPLP